MMARISINFKLGNIDQAIVNIHEAEAEYLLCRDKNNSEYNRIKTLKDQIDAKIEHYN